MTDTENNLVNLKNVRSDEQRKIMEQIVTDNVCPFCPEYLNRYHKNPILTEGKYWLITDNQWPYKNTKHQLLAIYKTHKEHLSELDPESGKELFELFGKISKERNMSGGAVTLRFGSSPYGNYGSTVKHIHAHLIEPDLQNEEREAIKFKIGDPNNRKDK